ncbi:hypothetical protein [Bradyrhizobium shewense]|uniref:hypothetical protein n=1 Tax=Bradyrhizobium shewense TaxID=1761772 RepID=UPI000B86C97F|nr:hypothetical protein [Bradyrhizobium shewense]
MRAAAAKVFKASLSPGVSDEAVRLILINALTLFTLGNAKREHSESGEHKASNIMREHLIMT